MVSIIESILFATIVAGTPLIIVALGQLIAEKSGCPESRRRGHDGDGRDCRLRDNAPYR